MSGAIQQDALHEEDLSTGDTGADAFLSLWSDKDASLKPSEDGDEEPKKKRTPPEETEDNSDDADRPSEEETEEDEGEAEEDTETSETEKPKAKALEDDAVVKVKVDNEDREVKVADLKRLYGQEAALTRKGQEVAATRKQLEDQGARHVAAAEAMLDRAREKVKPFENVDWVQAVVKLAPEEYQALRQSAQDAWADVQFYQQGLDGYMNQVNQTRQQELINEAKQSIKELSDPETGIKGFNKDVYNEMRSFAVSRGVPQAMVDQIVSAPALRIIHMAMLYEKGQKAATPKVVKTPTKIMKAASTPEGRKVVKKGDKTAFERLKKTGHSDDAEAAFLEMFSRGSDD
jgi:hypothetical protein